MTNDPNTTAPTNLEENKKTALDAYKKHVLGRYSDVTDSAANSMSGWTRPSMSLLDRKPQQIISRDTAETIIPIATGGISAAIGLLLLKPAHWISEKLFGAAKDIVTGFGYLPKIPVIGKVFEWLGKGIETVGKYAGYIAPAIAGVIGYSMFKTPPKGEVSKTPYDRIGRVGMAPVMAEVKVQPAKGEVITTQQVPVKPAAAPAVSQESADIVKEAGLKDVSEQSFLTVIGHRAEALKENKKTLELALGEYLGNQNQRMENALKFLDATKTFEKDGARKEIVAAMQKMGMSPEEAEKFVPTPPDIQATVFPDGTNFTKKLVDFAKKFDNFYKDSYDTMRLKQNGQLVFEIDRIENPSSMQARKEVPKTSRFDNMSYTQQEEFIAKALAFTQERFDFFKDRKIYYTRSPGGADVMVEAFDYKDRDAETGWFESKPEGKTHGIKWSDEHAFIKEVYDITQQRGIGLSYTKVGDSFDKVLADWKTQQELSSEHKDALTKDTGGKLAQYTAAVELMQQKLVALQKGELEIKEGKLVQATPKVEAEKVPENQPPAVEQPKTASKSAADLLNMQTVEDISAPGGLPTAKKTPGRGPDHLHA